MLKHWYDELEQKYIHLFETDKEGKPVRGIECGVGWARHVEDFLKSLEWQRTHNGGPHEIKIFQIKEKFGQARCYVTYPDKVGYGVETALGAFEGKCSITCEKCGELQYDCIKNIDGWVYCLCDNCMPPKEAA